MLKKLKIDPEFQSKIPPLTFHERNQLETNILEEGRILHPLIVWNGLIVDGHTRYAILRQHPEIQYTILEKDFANRHEAIIWICKNQLGRRNLTPEQRNYVLGKQYEAEKLSRGGAHPRSVAPPSEPPIAQNEQLKGTGSATCDRIAAEYGVSRSTVLRAETFAKSMDAAEEAVPGTRQAILSGKLKTTDKAISAIAKAPQEERPALVQQLYQPKPDKPMRRTPKGTAAAQYKAIEEISAKMEQPAGPLEQSDILAELEDALRLMISRWNTCLARNPDHRSACQAGIRRLAEEGVHYLQTMAQDDAASSYQTGIPQYIATNRHTRR